MNAKPPALDGSTRLLILFIGTIQGLLLLAAHEMILRKVWPATEMTWRVVGHTLNITIPLTLQMTLLKIRDRRPWLFSGGMALVLAGLSYYTAGTLPRFESGGMILPSFVLTIALGWFVALPFAQTWLKTGTFYFPYRLLFEHAWNNFLILAVAHLFMSLFWGLLMLWAGLFNVIGIGFFSTLFHDKYFFDPMLATALGFALSLARTYQRAIGALRWICLTLFRGLLPLLALIALLFVIGLTFTGLAPLWGTGRATLLMLTLQLLMILFLNAVYQTGDDEAPYPRWLREGVTVAVALLPVYAVLSAYALYLRIGQHGWSVDRFWAMLSALVIGLYACGYSVASFRSRTSWMEWMSPINVGMAEVVILLMILVNTPLLDPKGITLQSQWNRLMRGAVSPEQFDYNYLRSLGTQGFNAIGRLAFLQDHPQAKIIRERATTVLDQINCSNKPSIPAQTVSLKGTEAAGTIYFVPLETFPALFIDQLREDYRREFGLAIKMLPSIEIEEAVRDPRRGQLIAERLIATIKHRYPEQAADPETIFIGLTNSDMYIEKYTWRFAFSYRDEDRFAVVSSARMDPLFYNEPQSEGLLYQRMRKMVLKNIGIIYYRLPQNNDKNSVLCAPILGIEDLDHIGAAL